MPWFVKIEKGIVEKEVFDRYVDQHINYVKKLAENGHQPKTGYWGELGGGMMIFQAESLDEAEAIVSEDPLVKNNCVEFMLHQWVIVFGD